MLAVNDTVHYGMDGVCQVTGIVTKKWGESNRDFYELHPCFRKHTVIYLPVDNEQLLARVRPVLSREEILSALHSSETAVSVWVEGDTARRDAFQAIIRSGDHLQLVRLIKTLYQRRLDMEEDGRKLRSADSSFLKDAERLLHEEFAFVLGIEPAEVPAFIKKELG